MTNEKQTTIHINVNAENATINLNKELLEELGLDINDGKQQKGNKITYDDAHDIAYIHFDNGAEPTIVDTNWGQLLEGKNLQKHTSGYTTLAFKDADGKQNQPYLHRLILGVHNDNKNVVVDHINNDPNDNRVHKLRVTTQSSNVKNKKKETQKGDSVEKLTVDNQLALKIMSGIYDDLVLTYSNEQRWLDDYKWICEVGADKAIATIIQVHKKHQNQLDVVATIEESKRKLDELKKDFIENSNGASSGIVFDENGKAYLIDCDTAFTQYEPFKYKK